MADNNVIDIVIRARDESAAALRATQAAIDEVARAQAALAAAERAKADADRAAAAGSSDQAEALRRQAAAADAAAAAERRLAEAERAAAAAAARIRGAGGGGGGGAPPPGGGGPGPGPDDDRLSRVLDSISRDLGGFGEQIKALIPVLNNLKTTTIATATAIAAAGDRLRRGAPPPGPNPPPPPPGPNPPPPPGPNPPPPPPGGGDRRNAAAQTNLIQQLIDVSVQAAAGTNPLLILIQQGPQIAMAISAATSATALFAGMLATMKAAVIAAASVLAPLAVALAAAATAYAVIENNTQMALEAQGHYSRDIETAIEKLGRLRSASASAADGYTSMAERTVALQRELAVATGELDKNEASALADAEAIRKNLEAQTLADRQLIVGAEQVIKAYDAKVAAKERHTDSTWNELEAQAQQAKAERDFAMERIARAASEAQMQTEAVQRLAALKTAQDAETASRRRSTSAARAQAQALSEVEQALKASLPVLREALAEAKMLDDFRALGIADIVPANFVSADTISRARELGDALQALAPSKNVLTDLEQLQMLLMDIQRANIDSGGRLGGLEADATAAYSDALDDTIETVSVGLAEAGRGMGEAMNAIMDTATQRAAGVGAQIGAIIGGDISGVLTSLLASTGPVGAAIGGALEGLAALGEQGAGKTTKMITGFLSSIIKGLSSLPALIVKLVPSLIVDVLPDLVVALVGAIPRLVVAILIELPVAIVRGIVGWWRDIGGFKGLARSIADGVRDWWQSTWDRIKSWVRDIFRPNQKNEGANSRNMSDQQRDMARNLALYGSATTPYQQATGDMSPMPGDSGYRGRDRGNAARGAGPTIVLQGDLTPDFVPALGRRLDRYNGPGGLRSGTTILGST